MSDNSGSFFDFQQLVKKICETTKHTQKRDIIKEFLTNFNGDVWLLYRLLLCKEDKRVYNVREKSLLKNISTILGCSLQDMLTDLENGDIGETAKKFFLSSGKAQKTSTLTLKQIDDWLEELTTATKEDQQIELFRKLLKKATPDDLRLISKIIDHDLKANIGARYALVALHPDAFTAYKNSNNLKAIVQKALKYSNNKEISQKPGLYRKMSLSIDLMTPIKPMLAKQSKSFEDTVMRCPNGMITEIKYDGERIQIHKNKDKYLSFSRNLNPMAEHKVDWVSKYIPESFKNADTMILDGEILLMDSETKQPLPFGTLGIQKKKAFSSATVCLFIFDILYLNGEILLETPLCDRRKILEKNVNIIPGRIELSEIFRPKNEEELKGIFFSTVMRNIEGLMVKDARGIYEPDLRHWIKIKKEQIDGMGDSADLIVLGAYYGTGSKGGLMSIFLMGVYDEDEGVFKTVCKAGNGFSDKAIEELQTAFPVVKIEKDPNRCPSWLSCSKIVLPDFVVENPKQSPIWEVIGAEFTLSQFHTANRISIRFPRVSRVRDDKDWKTATSLKELQAMFDAGGINRKRKNEDDEDVMQEAVPKKRKTAHTKVDEEISKVNYVVGNLSEPHELTNDFSSKKMIILLVNKSGKWPSAGNFGIISSKWKKPQEIYLASYEKLQMGDIHIIDVGDKIYVGLLCALKVHNGIPPINMDAVLYGLDDILSEAKEREVSSIHMSKLPNDTPNLKWGEIDKKLQVFANNGVKPYIYEKSNGKKQASIETKVSIQNAKIEPEVNNNIFKGFTVLFYGPKEQSISKTIRDQGGKIVDEDDEDVPIKELTHIVTNNPWEEMFVAVLEENKSCKIVTTNWVKTCILENRIVPERHFFVERRQNK